MKSSRLVASLTLLAAASPLFAQSSPAAPAAPAAAPAASAPVAPPAAPRARTSPHEAINGSIDGVRVSVVYGRPYSAKGGTGEKRKIWGTLVPYGEVWRMGSDEATLLIAEKDITVGGAAVPAGAYTLWLLPAADGSAKLIINKQVGQWGIDRNQKSQRDEKFDLAIVDLSKDTLSSSVDQFTIAVAGNRAGGGLLKIVWEETQYSVALAAKK